MAGCPNDELMAAFTEGRLDTDETTRLHEHVDGCQSCQWLLKELAASAHGDVATQPGATPLVLAPGTVLGGRYRLERMLGTGGMGTVWSAIDVGTNRPAALKMLRPEKGGTSAARLRFLREARVLGRIDHPNLVPVRDVFDEGGVPVLAMDLLVGESLGERLRRDGRLALAELSRLMLGPLAAVDFAHASGVVHRDLKPDNLFLLQSSTEMRVLDFGIAKLMAKEDVVTLTGAGEVLGTPPYMAPEQLRGEAAIDRRADVWAFGVILYECLSGKRPFGGDRFGQIFEQVTTGTRQSLAAAAPGLPREVTALVEKMLTVDLRARCADLREVIAVLEKHAVEAAPPAKRTGGRWWALGGSLVAGVVAWQLLAQPRAPMDALPAPSPEASTLAQAQPSPAQPSPVAQVSPEPVADPCRRAWGEPLGAQLCEVPVLAMREAAYRVGRELAEEGASPERRLHLDGERQALIKDLAACAGDEACLLKRLQAAAPRTSVIDCAHAVSEDAKAICQRANLAQLAGSLAAHYQTDRQHYAENHRRLQRLPGGRFGIGGERGGVARVVPAPAAFSAEQTAWVIARHRCGEDEPCLTRMFEERIAALREIHRSFAGD